MNMLNRINTSILIVCVVLWHCASGDDCIYKECTCSGKIILCNQLGLQTIPLQVAKKDPLLTSLTFDNNNISTIPSGRLPPNLTEISILHNPIRTIDDTAFLESSDTLDSLSFSEFLLTRIPDAFLHLNKLSQLIISDAFIQDWNLDVMAKLGLTVQVCYLENVGLKTWPSWLSNFSQVTELSVVNNSFSDIPDDGLNAMANSLTSLSLNNNRLTLVPKALSKLKALQMLYLQFNKIFDVTWLSQSGTLYSLSLNNNEISDVTQLSNALRPFAGIMYHLDLQNNKLTTIPDFHFMKEIGELDFSNNIISDSYSGAMPPALTTLNLDKNSFRTVPKIIFNLTHMLDLSLNSNFITEMHGADFPFFLKAVDLGANFIRELTETSFPLNSNILILQLNNNPIIQIAPQAFTNVPQLTELNLQNTQLTRLPLALASLTKLSVFKIDGSSHLVCTCEEKSLAELFLSMSSTNVLGSCGQASVYYFFANLSPMCPTE